ncbi:STAS domain-containing protein [Actinoplanes italicus]|uniref:Anti-sigma factor antagonist n=1 Tax=Actinoplanes italicus TaxID=113567 RepID=A0A2T0JXR3_9ACTN|nr:STAS domain-containing protein [Actinoplanes italicus]PRX12593.1 anti-sigma B factor antagonist [Actinoplanes italicus]
MDLQLSARAGKACTVVKVGGQLDMATAPELDRCIRQVADDGGLQVVLDLADVSFLDSSGLGVLLAWFKELRSAGGRLCVAAVQEIVAYVLQVAALDQVMEVYDTVGAAEADMPPLTA